MGLMLTPLVKASNRWPAFGAFYEKILQTLNIHPGVERWAIKTLADPDAANVNFQPIEQTVTQLNSLKNSQPNARQSPVEFQVYQVEATLFAYKMEVDGDFHLALKDGTSTMIAEISDPDFLTPNTAPAPTDQIRQARVDFSNWANLNKKPVGDRYTYCDQKVTITGVGFFDFNHGQKGVAKNAIELHPVLSVKFL